MTLASSAAAGETPPCEQTELCYLFVGQVELLAQLGLVLCSQVRVPLEDPLHAADLLRREGRARSPP